MSAEDAGQGTHQPAEAGGDERLFGCRYDLLPGWVRQRLRFGAARQARLAELLALRREIDGLSARLGRAAAHHGRQQDSAAQAQHQAAWIALRAAGLALLAEIDAAR